MGQHARRAMNAQSGWLFPCIAFALPFFVYIGSRNTQVWDSQFTVLASQSLLWHGEYNLDRHFPEMRGPDGAVAVPYQLEAVDGHVYLTYPPGTPVLVAPIVALANLFGTSASDGQERPLRGGERQAQRLIAALLTSGATLVLYATARIFLSPAWSLTIALATALGTQYWSTASRALWAHTGTVLLLATAIWLLTRAETKRHQPNMFLLGTLVSWLYFVRPTNAVSIILIVAFVGWRWPRHVIPMVGVGMLWLAGFILWSQWLFGTPFPPYYMQARHLSLTTLGPSLAGQLVSPSRGLLVYVPVLLFVIYQSARYAGSLPQRALAWLAVVNIVANLLVLSLWQMWWGGHCYGPRLTTDLIPWFCLLAILSTRAAVDSQPSPGSTWQHRTRTIELTIGMVLLAISIAIHARGAWASSTATWNRFLDQDQTVLSDWSRAQCLSGITFSPPME